jgi:hypothetical protein
MGAPSFSPYQARAVPWIRLIIYVLAPPKAPDPRNDYARCTKKQTCQRWHPDLLSIAGLMAQNLMDNNNFAGAACLYGQLQKGS